MTDEPLLRKLQVKRGRSLRLIGAPHDYVERISPLPGASVLKTSGEADVVQLFVRDASEVSGTAQEATEAAGRHGVLWISYPKSVANDAGEMGWDPLEKLGWRQVTHISIDETWEAVRFRFEEDVTPRAR